jgi:hypothetical protein
MNLWNDESLERFGCIVRIRDRYFSEVFRDPGPASVRCQRKGDQDDAIGRYLR